MDRSWSGGAAAVEPEDSSASFIVFDGSSPAEVSHARQLWSSVFLLPPLECRLMSADIRQRLPVARPQRAAPKPSSPEPPTAAGQRREERQRYAAMAEQRREVLALLRRQREQRIRRELVSVAVKPKPKPERETLKAPDRDEDKELVRQLQ
ncbi:hypothetical protein fugu_015261 [Takifugu bimaculatus]|uniref:Cilia- and flagella-associated protein HOATZ n=1 Tax=Takifugu bimaculatus TaxID=433685 RepID=A0A4Z2BY45_9TELE|nr:hypothetical protein fugu_015261 [Takifugu bimaculatus]